MLLSTADGAAPEMPKITEEFIVLGNLIAELERDHPGLHERLLRRVEAKAAQVAIPIWRSANAPSAQACGRALAWVRAVGVVATRRPKA